MKVTLMVVSFVLAIGAMIAPAMADDAVYFTAFQGNPEKPCARLAGRPPGRAECRQTMKSGGALLPSQAYSVAISEFHGEVHYTSEENGLRIVATFSQDDGQTPIRMVSTLAEAQSVVISVPRKLGEPAAEVEIQRRGEFVMIREMPQQPAYGPPPERSVATRTPAH